MKGLRKYRSEGRFTRQVSVRSKATGKEGTVPSLSALARACGVTRTTIRAWQGDRTFPEQLEDGSFDVFEVGKWKGAKEEAKRPRERIPGDEDPLLASGDSPGLERYRMAKAQLAELDLGRRQGELIPVEALDAGLMALSAAYRRGVEQAQRLFGPEVVSIFEEALAGGEAAIKQIFGTSDEEIERDESNRPDQAPAEQTSGAVR